MSLYIVATPLGNLNDISARALEILSNVDLILAEDTRRTRKLLNHYKIKSKIDSFHAFSDDRKVKRVLDILKKNQDIALVTDAGTPAVSDPGSRLIEQIYQELPEVKVIPIPGPSAITTALSLCGFPADVFTFLGYSPKKMGKRTKFHQQISESLQTQVFFSTPHSIVKDLEALKTALTPHSTRSIFVGREMTKIFESYYHGNIAQIIDHVNKDPIKGEYTVVVSKIKKGSSIPWP